MVEQATLNPFGDTRADFSIPAPLRPFPGPTDLISIRDSILLKSTKWPLLSLLDLALPQLPFW